MRSLGLVFGIGMVVGIGGLLALPAKLQEPRPLVVRWREEAPTTCAQQASSKTGSKGWPKSSLKSSTETEPHCQIATQVGTQVGTTARRGPVEAEKAKSTPARTTAPVAKPTAPPEQPAARNRVVASTDAAMPDQAAAATPRPWADPPPKARKSEGVRRRIQVTVHAPDRSSRTIVVNPTTRQDAYYYTARPNVGLGSPTWFGPGSTTW
jgi:hypothetical protein